MLIMIKDPACGSDDFLAEERNLARGEPAAQPARKAGFCCAKML